MMHGTLLQNQPVTKWNREALDARRQTIAERHRLGATGAEVVTALTDLVDDIIVDLQAHASSAVFNASGVALVALGGYGRRELAPYSDVDLMFLYAPEREAHARSLSTAVLHALWDLGFQIGNSLRTIADCRTLGRADLTVRTSLMEARWLAGDRALFDEFTRVYREQVSGKGVRQYIGVKQEERRLEYGRFGSTNFLLEPNIKKGRGGLRDLHLLKWTGLARYGTSSLDALTAGGMLAAADAAALEDAQNFLWRVRNEMHFHACRAQDILTFDEQIRIAGLWGYKDSPNLLAVEQFMQQYYRHSTRICDITGHFVSGAVTRSVWQQVAAWLPARRLEHSFSIRGDELTIPCHLREQSLADGTHILRLFQLGQKHGLPIASDLAQELPERVSKVPDAAFSHEAAGRGFLAILADPERVADTLTAMHRARVLERLIPAFGRVRGLMQFNAYHKYTVDQHSLLAVLRAEEIGRGSDLLAQVYGEIKRKDVLHLAVLLHDLGKGQAEDHSIVGERMAVDVAARLGLDEHHAQLLAFLVRHHLLMSNTAFRRDPSDEKVVLRFSRQIGTPEALKMLYVLTAADISAVGPGVLTKWKETLRGELFLKTHKELAGDDETEARYEARLRIENVRQTVLDQVVGRLPEDWVSRQLEAWPDRYLASMSPARIVSHLEQIAKLRDAGVLVDVQFDAEIGASEYTVYTQEKIIPGIFSKIAGVLAAKGTQILDAQIATLADGVVVDVFRVLDADCTEDHREHRFREISGAMVGVLEGRYTVEDLLLEGARYGQSRQVAPLREPTVVQIDNDSSDRYTIMDVFADDRQGLLYVITRAIFDLGLSVHGAKISTKLDQVVDVFYVTSQSGGKIEDPAACKRIAETVKMGIDAFLGDSPAGRQVVRRGNA